MTTRRFTISAGLAALAVWASVIIAPGTAASSVQAPPTPTYQEPYRPQFHYTPGQNWMNDPNGLVYYQGEYHMFYQYNPLGNVWGNMSWGHAISRDLVHWTELPVAIPFDDQATIFSGSVVIDEQNTSGFGTSYTPAMAPCGPKSLSSVQFFRSGEE